VSVSSISRCRRISSSQISPQSTTSSFLYLLIRSEVTGRDSDDEINLFEVMGKKENAGDTACMDLAKAEFQFRCYRHIGSFLAPAACSPLSPSCLPAGNSNRGESTLPFPHFLKIATREPTQIGDPARLDPHMASLRTHRLWPPPSALHRRDQILRYFLPTNPKNFHKSHSSILLSVTCLIMGSRSNPHLWFKIPYSAFTKKVSKSTESTLISPRNFSGDMRISVRWCLLVDFSIDKTDLASHWDFPSTDPGIALPNTVH